MPAIAIRHPLHKLTSAEVIPPPPPVASLPDLRPATCYRPSLTGLKVLRAADVVLAADITDPARRWVCKGWDVPDSGTMPNGEPVMIVVVDLDMDTVELPWLIAAANELIPSAATPDPV